MSELNWRKTACLIFLLFFATVVVLPAQTFTTLHTFDLTDGASPYAGLIQATDGNLYGTTFVGGDLFNCGNGCGEVFKISASGELAMVYAFCRFTECVDGASPFGPVLQGTDGNFYGTTTQGGGALSHGTVFRVTPDGSLATLHRFDLTDGGYPRLGLIQGMGGNFYGATSSGGLNQSGTFFKITPRGTLTVLYNFCSQPGCIDGGPAAAFVQAADGNLYGTTVSGGASGACTSGCGTVFKLTPSGIFTTLHCFSGADGSDPGTLIQATNGSLYGIAVTGGANNSCINGCGTVFRITPSGTLRTFYNFCSQNGCPDGGYPISLIQASDGNFYGATLFGGTTGHGTIYRLTLSGALTTLYNLCSQPNCADGEFPEGALLQDTNGEFYGTTQTGGNGNGTVFSLSVGLGPFVETQRTFGKVGAHVKILGTNLIGATSVTFNGTAATFTVVSPSLIKTTVPAGATTGTVQVVTPAGTLSSNVPFRVLP